MCVYVSVKARSDLFKLELVVGWELPRMDTKNSGSLENQQTLLEGISSKSYNFFLWAGGKGPGSPIPNHSI